MKKIYKGLKNNKVFFLIGAVFLLVVIILKPSYATSYTRAELEDMVVSTALSYLYNNEYSDYNSKSSHPSFSYRTMKLSPEAVSRSNYFHIDCSSFTSSVYRYALNYDAAEYFANADGYLYDYKVNDGSTYFRFNDSITNLRKSYLINNRSIGASYYSKIAASKKKESGAPFISNIETNTTPVVYYYENENLDANGNPTTSIQESLTAKESADGKESGSYDFVKRLKKGDIIAWDGHVMIYVGNAVDSSSTGIIHSNGFDDYFVNDAGEIRINEDNSIRYNSIDYVIDKLNNSESPLTHIAIFRPINLLCRNGSASSCDESYTSGDVSISVNSKSLARTEFSKLRMEQYFKNKVVRVTDDSSSDYNRNLTKYNAVSVSDEITYYLTLTNKSIYSYCEKSTGSVYLTEKKCTDPDGDLSTDDGFLWKTVTSGSVDYNDLVISGLIPSGTSFVSCNNNCTFDSKTGKLSWNDIDVAAGASNTFSYTVKVEKEKDIVNEGMTVSNGTYSLQFDKLKVLSDSTFNNNINGNIFNEMINKFQKRVADGTIGYTTSVNESYKTDLNATDKIYLGSLSFPKIIYYNAFGIDLGDYTPISVKNALFEKVIRADNSSAYAYIFKDSVDENVKKMLVKGMYGGKGLYSVDPDVSIAKSSLGMYSLINDDNYRTQYADINSLEIGDIIIVYDSSNVTYMYCGRDASGNHQIAQWLDGEFTMFVYNASDTEQITAKQIFKEMFAHDLFVVLRPSQLYGTTVNLDYSGGTGSDSFYTAYGTYKNLVTPVKNSYVTTLNYNKTIGGAIASLKGANNFDGWYYNDTKVTNNSSLSLSSSHTLYAKWKTNSVILPNPNVTGYILEGWYSNSSLTTKVGNAGDSYTPTKDSTIYANWTPNTYEVKYNANGGTGTMKNSVHTYNEEISLSKNQYIKEGYLFLGWSLTKEGNVTYQDEEIVNNLTDIENDIVTLYAVWQKIELNEFSVKINTENGKTDETSKVVQKNENVSFTLTSDIGYGNPIVTCTNSQTASINNNILTIENVTANTTCDVIYKANTYEVKYNANIGTGTMENSSHTYGTAKELSKNTFTKIGYTFSGWSKTLNGEVEYVDEENVNYLTTKDKDIVNLYAVWKVENYTIKYNLNGGTVTNPESYNIETPTFKLNNPVKEGYIFTGWTGSNSATPEKDVTITKGTTGNKEYTVNYEEAKYKVIYKADNGTITGITNEEVTYKNSPTGTTSTPNEGYEVLKWAVDKDVNLKGGTKVLKGDPITQEEIKKIEITEDIVITIYHYKIKYSITYESSENGSISGIESEEVSHGNSPLGTENKPNKGYVLAYFIVDKDVTLTTGEVIKAGSPVTEENLSKIIVKENIKVTAVYEIATYKVTYKTDENGTITGIKEETKKYNESPTGTTVTPNKNYELLKWTADKEVTLKDNTKIAKGDVITEEEIKEIILESDITLTAHHIKTTFTVYYKNEAGTNITGILKEELKEGQSPKGTTVKTDNLNSSVIFKGNKDVTLKDGTIIKKGNVIKPKELSNIIVKEDLILTAYELKNNESNVTVPDTGSTKHFITVITGITLISLGGYSIYKRKRK